MNERICLHIDARKLQRIKLDGPAINVMMKGAAEQLFPLRRLARIHLTGTPEQGLDAFLACANQHIPVAFFDGFGRLKAMLYLPKENNTVLGHWLEALHTDLGIKTIYTQWQENIQLHWFAQSKAKWIPHGRISRSKGQAHDAKIIEESVAKELRKIHQHNQWTDAQPWMEGMLRVQLAQILDQFGLNPHTHEHRELLSDLEKPLQQMLKVEIAIWLIHDRPTAVSGKELTTLYERIAETVQHEAEKALWRLQYAIERIV